MRWLPFAALAALALALADVLVKQSASRISPSLGMLYYSLATVVFSGSWVLYQRLTGQSVFATQAGIGYAIGVGVAFSAVTLLLYLTFARVEVSVGAPVIRLVGILIASLIGILLLREPVTWRYAAGMALAVIGVFLITTR
jgi:drug/metabolite transporter (DMT)-like permease